MFLPLPCISQNQDDLHEYTRECAVVYPHLKGLAERNVQTVKNLFKKAKESGRDGFAGV